MIIIQSEFYPPPEKQSGCSFKGNKLDKVEQGSISNEERKTNTLNNVLIGSAAGMALGASTGAYFSRGISDEEKLYEKLAEELNNLLKNGDKDQKFALEAFLALFYAM